MPPKKLIPIPKDAPPGTVPTFREVIDRIYSIENTVQSNASEGNAGTKGLASTVQNLSGTVLDLNSRYSVTANGDFFYATGAIPADSTYREYGSVMSITIQSPGPHRQVVITAGAGEVRVDSKSAASGLAGQITFKFNSQPSYGSFVAQVYVSRITLLGVPISVQRTFNLQQGQYTVTAVTRGWNGTSGDPTNDIQFTQPYLRAEIIAEV